MSNDDKPQAKKIEVQEPDQPDQQSENPESSVKPEEPPAPEEIKESEEPDETSNDGLGDTEQVMHDEQAPKPAGKFKRFFAGYWRQKRSTLPLTVLLIVVIVLAVPTTRYSFLALGLKRSFEVSVTDSKTGKAVSGAAITLDGQTLSTNNEGTVTFHVKVGSAMLQISKKYYQALSANVFVGISTAHNSDKLQLMATGRQVPIKVVNKITGQPVADADIKVLGTDAKTDANGQATIVLPTSAPTQSATITAGSYNDVANLQVEVTSSVVSANTFALTPTGRVYFLSNLSGNIDVVSTNLDGSDRKIVLAGTGSEDPNNTVLLASRDWKYLTLLSKRTGGQNPKLFLINTTTGQVTDMESNAATFTLVGWEGHYFVYDVNQPNVQVWQSGQTLLKSYNADTRQALTLDQTSASGTSNADYTAQDFGYNDTYATGNQIVYIKEWAQGYQANSSQLNGKQDQILIVAPDGSGQQVLKNFPASSGSGYQTLNSIGYNPVHIYFQVGNSSGSTYYDYANGTLTQSNTITDNSYQQYQQSYVTYLQSPSGQQTFWAEQRDGKNTLFVGDVNGNGGKQIATLSDYTSYGWYSDSYVLVEKAGNELFIMPSAGGTALKISDYYKPQHTYYGYGGGYGGL